MAKKIKKHRKHKKQLPPLWERRTCDTCTHQARCDQFFDMRYARLGMREPESWRNWACKMYREKRELL